jgi:hypothetical protein
VLVTRRHMTEEVERLIEVTDLLIRLDVMHGQSQRTKEAPWLPDSIPFTSAIKVAVRRFESQPITARVTNSRARLHTLFQTFGTLFSFAFPPSPPRGRPLKGANISQS